MSKNAPGCEWPVKISCVAFKWFVYPCASDRTIAIRSARAANPGKCSHIVMPGTAVEIGLNSPRIPSGASGFMSNESRCESPPVRNTRMTDFARGRATLP